MKSFTEHLTWKWFPGLTIGQSCDRAVRCDGEDWQNTNKLTHSPSISRWKKLTANVNNTAAEISSN